MYEKRKKVLLLITKSNWGGAQRYIFDLATNLPKDSYEVVVALGGNGILIQKLKQAGIRTIVIQSLQRDISLKKELLSFREIDRIVRTEQPDILHVNSSKAGGIGALVGRIRHVPKIVYTAHGWAFNESRSAASKYLLGFFHWLTIQLAHVTIAVSDTLQEQMRWPRTRQKMITIYNGREIPNMLAKDTAREQLIASVLPPLAQDEIWGATIGELHPIKQHDITIKAIARIAKTFPSYRHIIIGDGDERDTLQKLITGLGLEKNVFLIGHIHEAAQFLKAFDLFVLSSKSEALAYVIIEAAQAGIPIVASRVGGIPEIITHEKEGLLVPANDVGALTDALTELIANKDLREKYGYAARERGLLFTAERMYTETVTAYKNI